MKQRIYEFIEKGSFGKSYNRYFDYFISILIVLNIVAISIDSLSNLNEETRQFLRGFEIFSVIVFTIEYILRLCVADLIFPRKSKPASIMAFIFSPLGLMDLFAILPFYLPVLIKVDLRFIRVFRLFRFIRIFKITRYNNALKLIADVFRDKKTELSMTFFSAFVILIVSSFLMYYVEGNAQPDKFPDVFSGMWWAIVTLTTIGYGDVFPITTLGKILSGIVSVLGIGLIALPTGILSAGFIELLNKKKINNAAYRCPHCGGEINH
jgi:voltage-gated potassium channel